MDQKNKRALKEVWVVLDNAEESIKGKIPKEIKEYISSNMDNDYEFNLDGTKTLKEQNLMAETKYLVSALYGSFINPTGKVVKGLELTELKKQSKIKEFFNKIFKSFKAKSNKN